MSTVFVAFDNFIRTLVSVFIGVPFPRLPLAFRAADISFADYCDIPLTREKLSVRKDHNSGYKHKLAVRNYYAQFLPEGTIIDEIPMPPSEDGRLSSRARRGRGGGFRAGDRVSYSDRAPMPAPPSALGRFPPRPPFPFMPPAGAGMPPPPGFPQGMPPGMMPPGVPPMPHGVPPMPHGVPPMPPGMPPGMPPMPPHMIAMFQQQMQQQQQQQQGQGQGQQGQH